MKKKASILKKSKKKQRIALSLFFSLFIFLILLTTLLMALAVVYFFLKQEVLFVLDEYISEIYSILLFMGGVSLFFGTALSFLASRILLGPLNHFVNHLNRLAAGDFKTRMHVRGGIYNLSTVREISDSFNMMAEELENTEMLRSDFINHFSHEFKTPIVSIAGLAKVLKKGNLPEEQKQQYFHAIEEESMRLAAMATNVLNLTKVENQAILGNVSTFNLSEQIRSAILLLENKWAEKNIELQLDFDEHIIEANEELLKQVWINLIDNAVKFVPRCGTVFVSVEEAGETLLVSIGNTGSEISPAKQRKIWNKFYQGDESHAGEGNGIGLAIVRRIIELHGGAVAVRSGGGVTVFSVELLKKQR